jgi:hypothetical protein
MQPAAKRKGCLAAHLTALRVLLLLVVACCGLQTRVWGFAPASQPASGEVAFATRSFVGENHHTVPYDAADSLVAAKTPLWTSTKSKTAVENAFGHWQKHGAEFPEFQNAKQYVEGAKDFVSKPPSGTLTKTRPNGDTLFYNPANNTFGVQAADGAPRTMFRPTDGINYWNKQ